MKGRVSGSLHRRRGEEPHRRPEVQEPAAAGMAHQKLGKAARPQVHANAVGLQRFGWALPVRGYQARHDAARPWGGRPGPPDLPCRVREVAAELGRTLDFFKVPNPRRPKSWQPSLPTKTRSLPAASRALTAAEASCVSLSRRSRPAKAGRDC